MLDQSTKIKISTPNLHQGVKSAIKIVSISQEKPIPILYTLHKTHTLNRLWERLDSKI